MIEYPEQQYDYGEFTCRSCHTTFSKADPGHGASGFCTQCEIANGLLKIHGGDQEANEREQRETKSMIAQYNLAMRGSSD